MYPLHRHFYTYRHIYTVKPTVTTSRYQAMILINLCNISHSSKQLESSILTLTQRLGSIIIIEILKS